MPVAVLLEVPMGIEVGYYLGAMSFWLVAALGLGRDWGLLLS